MFEPLRDRDPAQVGRFRLRTRLGSGGMGEVFLAFDEHERPVAVKVLRGELADDRQFRARFAHEVRSARRVHGPTIASLIDADPDAETPWLATEYVAGPTLSDAVELYGPLPVASVIVLIAGIAEALQAIHGAGIVHRDLKPPNVVVGPDGLRVIDFGIARAADATPLTLTGMMVGSPQYVAPEQALGEPPTPAGDIFSLGALAHYAATGRAAFGDGPRIAVLYRIVNEKPDLAGCPRQIRSLIESCLARHAEDRPSTAEIIEMCTPDEPPRTAADWLPTPVVFAIDAYRAKLADIAATGFATADGDGDGDGDGGARADAGAGAGAGTDGKPQVTPVAAPGTSETSGAPGTPTTSRSSDALRTPGASDALDAHDALEASESRAARMKSNPDADTYPLAPRSGRYDSDASDASGGSGGSGGYGRAFGARGRLQRAVVGVAAALAVVAVGVGVAFIDPSGDSSTGLAVISGGSQQQGAAAGQVGATQSAAGQTWSSTGIAVPPYIPGLGSPLGPPPGTQQAGGPGGPGGPPPGGPPPGGPGPGPVPTPTVLWWSGTVRITSAGLWLDGKPPIPAQGHGDLREATPASNAELLSAAPEIQNIARWTGSGTPTGPQCTETAMTHGTSQLHVSVGDTVCALTAYRQVAVLRIDRFPTDGSGVTATVTVWGSGSSTSTSASR